MFFAAAYFVFCLACAVLAFTRHPVYGLYFYLATIYVFPPSRWWGYMVPDLRWALFSAAVTALAIMFHRGRLAPKPLWCANAPAILLITYTTWMWIQTPWAMDLDGHVNGAIKFMKYLIAFWFVYRIADTKEMIRNLLGAHVIGCSLLGIYAFFTPREQGRLDGVGGPGIDDANTLAMYLGTAAVVCLALVMVTRGWRRWLWLPALALIFNGFVLANSRGAFLGLLTGGFALWLAKARSQRKVFYAFALIGVIGFAISVDKVFVERMFTIGDVVEQDEDADMSARSRMEIYKAQLRMVLDHPLGAGYRGTAELSPQYLERKWLVGGGTEGDAQRASHNTFLTALVEQGMPGAFLFICLYLWIAGSLLRLRRLDRIGKDPDTVTLGAAAGAGLAVVMVAGSAADYLMAEVQFWLFALLVSALHLLDPAPAGAARGRPAVRPTPGPGHLTN